MNGNPMPIIDFTQGIELADYSDQEKVFMLGLQF
jgi:hypothetical protein